MYASRETNQPFLVAEGLNKATISKYWVVVDGKFIPCSENASSAEAIETLFKTHFVFNVKYDQSLESFWQFIEIYFCELKTNNYKFTSKMVELRSRLANTNQ